MARRGRYARHEPDRGHVASDRRVAPPARATRPGRCGSPNLFARLSPWQRCGRDLYLVRPLSRMTEVPAVPAVPGMLALLVVMIGSTSFDGASAGEAWGSIAPDLQSAVEGIALSPSAALEVTLTIGLLVSILLIAGVYRIGISGMRTVGRPEGVDLAGRFAHTLVPIALAYVVRTISPSWSFRVRRRAICSPTRWGVAHTCSARRPARSTTA